MKLTRNLISAWILVVWTLLLWVSRVRNVLVDEDLDSGQRIVRLLLPVLFISFAGIAALALVSGSVPLRRAPMALAALSVLIWPIRAVQILLQDWSTGFKVVHSILAVGSVGLGLWVLSTSEDVRNRRIQARASRTADAGSL